MSNFFDILNRSKKSIAKDMKYSEADAQLLYKLLKQYWETHEGATNSETYEFFEGLFMKINEDIVTLPSIKSNNIKYYICKRLADNPQELAEAYKALIEEEQQSGKRLTFPSTMTYDANVQSCIKILTTEALVAMREMLAAVTPKQKSILERYSKLTVKEQKKYREHCTMPQIEIIDYYVPYMRRRIIEFKEVFGRRNRSIRKRTKDKLC